jgi:2-keto-3-deoxy-L-rhamnonate aldolase RhmA
MLMRTPPHRIRNKLESGERVFGATIQLACPEAAEIAGYAGLDYVWLDAEHGTMDLGDINEIIRAADASGIDAIVRIPDHTPSFIQRVLDIGAAGIMAPHVRTVADAAAIVAAAKFAPAGTRGACPCTRWMGHVTSDWVHDYRCANADVLVFGLIEDLEGVDNVEQIAQESGLDGLVFGPFDLAQSSGLEGDVTHPDIEKMHARVTSAARAAGIEYIALVGWEFGGTAAMATNSRIINVTSDRGALFGSFQRGRADIAEQLALADGE